MSELPEEESASEDTGLRANINRLAAQEKLRAAGLKYLTTLSNLAQQSTDPEAICTPLHRAFMAVLAETLQQLGLPSGTQEQNRLASKVLDRIAEINDIVIPRRIIPFSL